MTSTGVNGLFTAPVTPMASGNSDKSVKEAELISSFSQFMNENAMNYQSEIQGRSEQVKDESLALSSTPSEDYEKMQTTKNTTKVSDVKEKDAQGVQAEDKQVQEVVEKAVQDVKETIKEELGVTDEQIEAAMQTLGLSMTDLLNTQNLVQLVAQLTGSENPMDLLVMDNIQDLLQQVNGIVKEAMDTLGLTSEGFQELLTQMEAVTPEEAVAFADVVEEAGNALNQSEAQVVEGEAVVNAATEKAETVIAQEVVATKEVVSEQKVMNAGNGETVEAVVTEEATTEETGVDEMTVKAGTENLENQTEGESNGFDFKGHQDKPGFTNDKNGQFFEHQMPVNQNTMDASIPNNPFVASQMPYTQVDVEQLMNQFRDMTRVFRESGETTLQMQLNPENLGRMSLTVSSKEGVVTAQIAASNEQVKETLIVQMAELRASLSEQGIKVEAVEVTVETHAFEENLSKNNQMNQNDEQSNERDNQSVERTSGRRNLNMSELEDADGLDLSEEEALAARIMKDNGNSIDYNA